MTERDLIAIIADLIPYAESRAEDLSCIADDTETDPNFDAEEKAYARQDAARAWEAVEAARAALALLG